MSRGRSSIASFAIPLAGILVAGLASRVAYTLAQPGVDPTWNRPMLDGAYYLDWARRIVVGGGFDGVYYLGPLYPWLLSWILRLDGGLASIAVVQQLATVATAAALAIIARRAFANVAGWTTAVLVLLYHPGVFFAGRPLSEPLGLALLSAALAVVPDPPSDDDSRVIALRALAAGFLLGLASLARPSFLPIAVLWPVGLIGARRGRAALLVAVGAVLAVAPVTARNYAVSGHFVPVSANAGIVAWLGNAPDAVGVYTPVEGFSGTLERQQADAVALASTRAGRALDAVEADRFWGREAVRVRLADPRGTISLLARRLLLTLDDAEQGLDYAPALDRNPWRRVFLVPFALIVGLAAAGWVLRGFAGSGGRLYWLAALACAATPVLFYVSSRHRLPLAVLMTVPAGIGFAGLVAAPGGVAGRRLAAIAAGALIAGVSWLYPSGELSRTQEASALANLAVARKQGGDLAGAEKDLRRALVLDPECVLASFNLGVVLERSGRRGDAEAVYRDALEHDPAHAAAAGNLAGLLVARGAGREAVDLLREILPKQPECAVCWTNLVVALVTIGDANGARAAVAEAAARGVTLDEELVDAVRAVEVRSGD